MGWVGNGEGDRGTPPGHPGLTYGRRLPTSHRRVVRGLQSRVAGRVARKDSKGGRGDQRERWRWEKTETDRQEGMTGMQRESRGRRARFETQKEGREGKTEMERDRRQKDKAQMRQRGQRQAKAGEEGSRRPRGVSEQARQERGGGQGSQRGDVRARGCLPRWGTGAQKVGQGQRLQEWARVPSQGLSFRVWGWAPGKGHGRCHPISDGPCFPCFPAWGRHCPGARLK